MTALQGYRTYIAAAVLAGVTVAKALGYLSADQATLVIGALTSLGLTFGRVATSNVDAKVDPDPTAEHTPLKPTEPGDQ